MKYSNILLLTKLFCLLTIISVISSCTKDAKNAPNVSYMGDLDIELTRSEDEIQALDTTVDNILQQLYDNDDLFYSLYLERVLRVPVSQMSEKENDDFIKGFIRDARIQRIQNEVDSVFGDFSDMKQEFEQAFKYAKHYLPEKEVPGLYTYISEYSLQKFLFEKEGKDYLAIGLDMFLGEDYPYSNYVRNNTSFSAYLTRTFNKKHLVRLSLEALVEDWLSNTERGETLLDKMLYNGKKLYILQKLLPETEEAIIMGYTEKQMQWCKDNEQEMWAFFFKEDLFYSTDINKISKLVSASPSSAGMPPESPGRTANYMGWQIIEAFMKRNEYDLKTLINLDNYSSQRILEESKFKPKRR